MNSNQTPHADRGALYAHAEAYLEALTKRDPSRLPWADRVVFTENNVQLAVGDGTWNTASGRRGMTATAAIQVETGSEPFLQHFSFIEIVLAGFEIASFVAS